MKCFKIDNNNAIFLNEKKSAQKSDFDPENNLEKQKSPTWLAQSISKKKLVMDFQSTVHAPL